MTEIANASGARLSEHRRACYRCHKPQVTCICDSVSRVRNQTRVWVIQHPRERFHPIGTERIARLGLENVHVEVCFEPSRTPPAGLALGSAGVLYPGGDAVDLSDVPAGERPADLIVIDGTWSHAHTIYRDNEWLHALPRYAITPAQASRYRIRKEPARECVSTIEAIVYALSVLEPETDGLQTLLDSFEAMIDEQIAITAARRTGKRRPANPRSQRGVPRAIALRPETLVAVYCEASRHVQHRQRNDRSLIQFAAERAATGETFERFVQPPSYHSPKPRHLHHMGLSTELLDDAITLDELRAQWSAFLGQNDVVIAWNQSTLDLYGATFGDPPQSLLLKSVYCRRHRGPCGRLEDVVAREQLSPPPPRLQGRAGQRLANLLAVLSSLALPSSEPAPV